MIVGDLHRSANRRTDKARNRYPAFTLHRVSHKPFLMLSVMDMLGNPERTLDYRFSANFIEERKMYREYL